MNGYIIDPAWFYWIGVVDYMKSLMTIVAVVSILAGGLMLLFTIIDDDNSISKKILLKTAIAGAVCFVIAVLIPSKETLIAMQVAKYATWENANWTVDAVKEAVDYIVNALGSME